MRKLLLLLTLAWLTLPALADKPDVSKIYGKIQIVDSFPDYKVEVVDSFPDLKVQKVDSFADGPGEWQMVDSFPDFTIKYVDSFPGPQ